MLPLFQRIGFFNIFIFKRQGFLDEKVAGPLQNKGNVHKIIGWQWGRFIVYFWHNRPWKARIDTPGTVHYFIIRNIKYKETFGKCSILFKVKEDENFNRRNTLSILRIKIW